MEFKLTSVFHICATKYRISKDSQSIPDYRAAVALMCHIPNSPAEHQPVTDYYLSFIPSLVVYSSCYVQTPLTCNFSCVIPNSGPPDQYIAIN